MSVQRLPLAERYRKRCGHLIADFEIRLGSDVYQFRAIFQASPRIAGSCDDRGTAMNKPDKSVVKLRDISDSDYQYVLIQNVEIVNLAKELIPSFAAIWLKGPDEVNGLWGGPVYMSLFKSAFKAICVPCNLELDALIAASVGSYKCTHQKIEHGTKVVNRIPNDSRKLFWDFFLDADDQGKRPLDRMAASISLDDYSIGIPGKETCGLGVQLVDMLFGPVNF